MLQGYKEEALVVSRDPDQKFELALDLKKLAVAQVGHRTHPLTNQPVGPAADHIPHAFSTALMLRFVAYTITQSAG